MSARASHAAMKRATFAMLRSLGATDIVLRTAVSAGNDDRGLGRDQFEIAEVRLMRALVKQVNDKPLRLEIVVSAAEVESKLGTGEEDAAETLRKLDGVCWTDHLLHITGVSAEIFAGRALLYRITAEA